MRLASLCLPGREGHLADGRQVVDLLAELVQLLADCRQFLWIRRQIITVPSSGLAAEGGRLISRLEIDLSCENRLVV